MNPDPLSARTLSELRKLSSEVDALLDRLARSPQPEDESRLRHIGGKPPREWTWDGEHLTSRGD